MEMQKFVKKLKCMPPLKFKIFFCIFLYYMFFKQNCLYSLCTFIFVFSMNLQAAIFDNILKYITFSDCIILLP